MGISTSAIGISDEGTVEVYVPPNVIEIPFGYNVINGTYIPVTAGDQVTLSGINQLAGGSGLLQATGPVTYRTVTITAPSGG